MHTQINNLKVSPFIDLIAKNKNTQSLHYPQKEFVLVTQYESNYVFGK